MAQALDSSEIQPGGLENYMTGSLGNCLSALHPFNQDDGHKLHRCPTTIMRSTSAYKKIPEPLFKTSSCEVLAETAKPSDVVITQHPFVYVDPKPAKRTKRLKRLSEFPGCLVFDSHPTPGSGARHRANHPVSPENIGEVVPHSPITGEIDPLTTASLESHLVSISSASPSQSSFPGAAAWPLLHQEGPYTAFDRNGRNESFHANACGLSQSNQREGGDVMIHPDAVTAGDGSTWQVASNRAGDTRDIPPSLPNSREPGYGAPSTNGQYIFESQFHSHTAHFTDDSYDIDAYNAQPAYSNRSLNCRFDTGECSAHRTLTHHHMRTEHCGCTLLYRASGSVGPVGVLIHDKGHGYEDTSAQDGTAPDTIIFDPYLLELGAPVPFGNGHRCSGA